MAIKLIDPSARFELVSQFDESIDGTSEAGNAAFEQYMHSLDQKDLIKNPDSVDAPTLFVTRCLLGKELTALQEKHISVDTVSKKTIFKSGYTSYLLECFELGCLGIKMEDGSVQKVSVDEVGIGHASSIGSLIAFMTSVGKNLKKI